MGKIIILEGPDGAGKTTIAGKLKKRDPTAKYVHTGPPTRSNENLLVTYAQVLYDALCRKENTIIDRLHIGESIYGPIYRGRDLLGQEGQAVLRGIITQYGIIEVLCMPPLGTAKQNFKKNHEGSPESLRLYELVYQRYQNSVLVSGGFFYNYCLDSEEGGLDSIAKSWLTPRSQIIAATGSLTPEFLLIGDVANSKTLDLPFMSLSGSSHFLYTSLKQAGYDYSKLAFVNANRISGEENPIHVIHESLGSPEVICLGRTAQNAWNTPSYHLNHPAHWLRFKSNARLEYVETLREIRVVHENRDRRNLRDVEATTERVDFIG